MSDILDLISTVFRQGEEPYVYGVPANLDLSFLHGAALAQIHLMPCQVNFVFDPDGRIFVEGEWRLFTREGKLIDQSLPWPRAEAFQLHILLNQKVAGITISAPLWLDIRFSGGEVLRLIDSSSRFESFMIEPGCIVV